MRLSIQFFSVLHYVGSVARSLAQMAPFMQAATCPGALRSIRPLPAAGLVSRRPAGTMAQPWRGSSSSSTGQEQQLGIVQHAHSGRSRRTQAAAAASFSIGAVAEALGRMPPLLPVSGTWGVWSALVAAGAFGMWSEKTRLGKELSGALVATLAGMALANTGVLPPGAPELHAVYKYVLPLAIPMLLFSADIRRMVRETGRLLGAFLLGAVATVGGTLVAWAAFPLLASGPLGDAGWRIASALTARHIGGAVNYMAVSDMLSIPPSVFGAGLAADDLILTLYFTTIYALAKAVPPDAAPAVTATTATGSPGPSSSGAGSTNGTGISGGSHSEGSSSGSGDAMAPQPAAPQAQAGGGHGGGGHGGGPMKTIQVLEALQALALSATICYLGTSLAAAFGAPGQAITIITGLTVTLATAAPKALAPLVPSAEGLAQVLMQIFYATIGASANVGLVVRTAPVLFLFSALALAAHLGLLLGVGKLMGFSRRELLLASNANIGGPSTVAGMAAAKGWTSSIVPGILVSTLGYAIGTFIGMGVGQGLLRPWAGAPAAVPGA